MFYGPIPEEERRKIKKLIEDLHVSCIAMTYVCNATDENINDTTNELIEDLLKQIFECFKTDNNQNARFKLTNIFKDEVNEALEEMYTRLER